jgi:formamidase
MSGLGGFNSTGDSVVITAVQSQLPSTIHDLSSLQASVSHICDLVRAAKRAYPATDFVLFPEYCVHGLSPQTWTSPELFCTREGEIVQEFRKICKEEKVWGCFGILERREVKAGGAVKEKGAYNTGVTINDQGEIVDWYRKMHPWVCLLCPFPS